MDGLRGSEARPPTPPCLAWTILRPRRLIDKQPTGLVALGNHVPWRTSHAPMWAAVLAAILNELIPVGHQWNLVSGDVPLADAVRSAWRLPRWP